MSKSLKIFISIIILLFLVSGIFSIYHLYQFNLQYKKEEYFREKNYECWKLYKNLQIEVEKNKQTNYKNEVISVFYSPIINSCLYIDQEYFFKSEEEALITYRLIDAFTKEVYESATIKNDFSTAASHDFMIIVNEKYKKESK